MSDNSAIEWCDATWNPVTGCTKVSPGCDHCYAETFAERWRGVPGHHFENGFDVTLRPDKLDLPLRWRKPRKVFVNSMSDLFHEQITDEFIADVFTVMALTPRHTYQVLTKRHGRMRSLLGSERFADRVTEKILTRAVNEQPAGIEWHERWSYPLPNVWLGVSVEDQQWADIRIPHLLATPAAVRFLSCEPLLGPVRLFFPWSMGCEEAGPATTHTGVSYETDYGTGIEYDCEHLPGIDWVIAGGESGADHRPLNLDWVRSLRDECQKAEVPFLFKQVGGRTPKSGGRMLDGRTHDEYPGGVS